jgi:DNA-binding response OmpR family regulator
MMGRYKVLLVDDEEEFASTLAERLCLRGIEARAAYDGEEALRLLETDPPHVMVLDVMMPGLGGLEVLKRAKVMHPEIPVILLTGHGAVREGVEGKRLGASDYLVKPINIEELIDKIDASIKTDT